MFSKSGLESHTSNGMTICGKCIKRFGIVKEEWNPVFMEELRSVVFGYKLIIAAPNVGNQFAFEVFIPEYYNVKKPNN